MSNSVSVIVPVYNEEQTLGPLLSSLIQVLPTIHEIVIVDNRSTDGTATVARQSSHLYSPVGIIQLGKNQGKTAALRTRFAASTRDIGVLQDADLEYDPQDIPGLIQPVVTGKAGPGDGFNRHHETVYRLAP